MAFSLSTNFTELATSVSTSLTSTISSVPSVAASSMSSMDPPSGLLPSATPPITATVSAVISSSQTWAGLIVNSILFFLKIIPGVLYWLITFTTLTLPTWLFAIFSTSLTFTLNATTL
jgi:lysophospholipid hydrolase